MPVFVYVYVFILFLRRKEYSAISLLTSLRFPLLTFCLIFKLSWKSQQSLVGKPAEKISNVFIISTCQVCLLLNDSLCKWDWLYFKEASCSCPAGLRSRSRPCLSCWFDLHLEIVLLLRKEKKKKKWSTQVWRLPSQLLCLEFSALPVHQALRPPPPITCGPHSFLVFYLLKWKIHIFRCQIIEHRKSCKKFCLKF